MELELEHQSAFDDKEIERLEEIRRFGVSDRGLEDSVYYQPKDKKLLERWTQWRMQLNGMLSSYISGSQEQFRSSTRELEEAPLFESESSEYKSQLLRRDFSGRTNKTEDWRLKFIKEESFIFYGIPRSTVRWAVPDSQTGPHSGRQSDIPNNSRGSRRS